MILEIKHLCKIHLACKYVIKQGKLQKRANQGERGEKAAYINSTYSRRSEFSVLNTVWNMSAVVWTDSRHLQAVPWWNTARLKCTGVWFLFLFTCNGTKKRTEIFVYTLSHKGTSPEAVEKWASWLLLSDTLGKSEVPSGKRGPKDSLRWPLTQIPPIANISTRIYGLLKNNNGALASHPQVMGRTWIHEETVEN